MTLDDAFSNLPVITTERLCIRQMNMGDAEAVFAFKSDPEVTRRYGQEPHRSIDETRTWLQRRMVDYERRDAIFWVLALKEDDNPLGECCLWNFDTGFHCAEIGYELHSSYWQKGIMAEALSAILTYGFVNIGLHRIEANPLVTNEASQRLLLKLGFTREGILRERHFFHDKYLDQMYFGLLEEEWKNRQNGL
jgi:ribosomal-protein-alanine N-acetyltransferase